MRDFPIDGERRGSGRPLPMMRVLTLFAVLAPAGCGQGIREHYPEVYRDPDMKIREVESWRMPVAQRLPMGCRIVDCLSSAQSVAALFRTATTCTILLARRHSPVLEVTTLRVAPSHICRLMSADPTIVVVQGSGPIGFEARTDGGITLQEFRKGFGVGEFALSGELFAAVERKTGWLKHLSSSEISIGPIRNQPAAAVVVSTSLDASEIALSSHEGRALVAFSAQSGNTGVVALTVDSNQDLASVQLETESSTAVRCNLTSAGPIVAWMSGGRLRVSDCKDTVSIPMSASIVDIDCKRGAFGCEVVVVDSESTVSVLQGWCNSSSWQELVRVEGAALGARHLRHTEWGDIAVFSQDGMKVWALLRD